MPIVSIVGMKFRPPALEIIERIPSGHPLLLIREPANPHDPNAVGVWIQLGYIPATHAKLLAPRLDATASGLRATLPGEFQYNPGWPKVEFGT